jgi:hypothetical protein
MPRDRGAAEPHVRVKLESSTILYANISALAYHDSIYTLTLCPETINQAPWRRPDGQN